jgi:hypothetical protein
MGRERRGLIKFLFHGLNADVNNDTKGVTFYCLETETP